MTGSPLNGAFFDRDPQEVACDLIGKVLSHRVDGGVLCASIVETEAYYLTDKASHASLGYTEKRRALFMPPGTIYMYYARGGDSFNISCAGEGNAVLIKAGAPYCQENGDAHRAMIEAMHRLNPLPSGRHRPTERLCSGQTLLCRALSLRVPDWDGRPIDAPPLALLDVGYRPGKLVRTTRLGIPGGRDGHLPYRFVDFQRVAQATRNPLPRKGGGGQPPHLLPLPPLPRPIPWKALLEAHTGGEHPP